MNGRPLDGETVGADPIAIRTIPANPLQWIDYPNVGNLESPVVLDLLLHFGMAILRRQYFDNNELRMAEDGLNGNRPRPYTYIWDAHSVRVKPRSLFLNGPRLPLFIMQMEPQQNRSLNNIVIVLTHASFLDLTAHKFRIRLVRALKILFDRDAS